MSTYTGVTNF